MSLHSAQGKGKKKKNLDEGQKSVLTLKGNVVSSRRSENTFLKVTDLVPTC